MNYSLVKDKLPLAGTDVESVQATISKVLQLAGVVKFSVDARLQVVDFWRVPSEHETEEEIANPFRGVLKQVQMEEYVSETEESGERQLLSMCEILDDAGCYPVFILTGRDLVELRKWVKFPRKSSSIAGIPILPNPDSASDVLLLCGAKSRDAEPIDVSFVVKFTLP